MNRPFFAAGLACLGTWAVLACSGAVESAPDAPPTAEAGPPARRDAGVEVEAAAPPPRPVTKALVLDLGNVSSGQEVTFAVPAGALGFNVVVEVRSGQPTSVGVERITSPSGERVHDNYTPKGGSFATSGGFGTIISAAVPQSEAKSANTPEPGTWTVRIGGNPTPGVDAGADGGTNGPFHAEVRIQIGAATGFVGGRLDLRVYVPSGLRLGTKKLDATTAASDAEIERRLDVFFGALSAQVGIDRGAVTFHPIASSWSYVDDVSIENGFALSKGQPDAQNLDVLLTNAIQFTGGDGAWGVAPGIPGVVARAGTPMSGIIVAIGDTPAIGDGLTILHEAGHFVGLSHTTGLSGGQADPMTDTPTCGNISLDDVGALAACPDRSNIMFPVGMGPTSNDLSNTQRAVYRGAPLYLAYKEAAPSTMRASRLVARPGEQVTLTKSGRALTPVETWLSSSLCAHPSHGKSDVNVLIAKSGRVPTILALRAASVDADLPAMMRRKASAALHVLEGAD